MYKYCLRYKSLKLNHNNFMPKYCLLLIGPFKSNVDPIVIQMNELCAKDTNLFMQDKQGKNFLATSLGL